MKNRHLLALLFGLAPLLALFATTQSRAADATDHIHLNAELDYAKLSAEGNDTAIVKVSLRPDHIPSDSPRPPLNLAIVLDRSGSMSGSKIEMAKKAAARAFYALRPDDRVSIVSYSNTVETLLPLTQVRRIRNPHSYIDRISAGGGTAIYAGVNQAAAELRPETDEDYAINRILLLSDGLANQGPSTPHDFELLGRSLSQEGITVSTIGLGLDYNEDLMASLSAAGQGNVYFVESARDLPRIFEAELGDASSLVAKDVIIELHCTEGFEPVRILGRDGEIRGNKATVNISNLYGGQEKYVLIEVRNPGGEPNQRQAVTNVNVRIQDLRTGKIVVKEQAAYGTFATNSEERERSVNIEIQRDVVANKIALAQDEAIAYADRGDVKHATLVMNELNDWITTNNHEWKDEAIAEKAAALDRTAEQLEAEGMDKRARKEMRSSSYQTRSQQSSY